MITLLLFGVLPWLSLKVKIKAEILCNRLQRHHGWPECTFPSSSPTAPLVPSAPSFTHSLTHSHLIEGLLWASPIAWAILGLFELLLLSHGSGTSQTLFPLPGTLFLCPCTSQMSPQHSVHSVPLLCHTRHSGNAFWDVHRGQKGCPPRFPCTQSMPGTQGGPRQCLLNGEVLKKGWKRHPTSWRNMTDCD